MARWQTRLLLGKRLYLLVQAGDLIPSLGKLRDYVLGRYLARLRQGPDHRRACAATAPGQYWATGRCRSIALCRDHIHRQAAILHRIFHVTKARGFCCGLHCAGLMAGRDLCVGPVVDDRDKTGGRKGDHVRRLDLRGDGKAIADLTNIHFGCLG